MLDRRGRLVLVESWRPSTRSRRPGFRIESEPDRWFPSEVALGLALVDRAVRAGVLSARLVVEDVFFGRNPRTTISLCRWSALLVGAIQGGRPTWASSVEWVEADRWRSVAFNLPFAMKRAEAKRLVRLAVTDRYPTVARLGSDLNEHVADAIGIALYGVTTNDQQEASDAEKTRGE